MTANPKTLTIFTPTYNRAYILPQLYGSLARQTSKDFLWLIIDDGSTDETEELVSKWKQEEKSFPIHYHKQDNGGKQRAHNTAVQLSDTELFLCVDSDDYLINNAVELILEKWESVRAEETLSGIIALKGYDEETPMGTGLPKGISKSPLTELYQKHGFDGETALVFRTAILKVYPYDVEDGEKFITESYVYIQIDQHYSMAILDKIINICGYQDDGYTKNIFLTICKNPKSYMRLKTLRMNLANSPKYKFIDAVNLLSAYFIVRKRIPYFSWTPYTLIAFIPGYFLYRKRFAKFCKKNNHSLFN